MTKTKKMIYSTSSYGVNSNRPNGSKSTNLQYFEVRIYIGYFTVDLDSLSISLNCSLIIDNTYNTFL